MIRIFDKVIKENLTELLTNNNLPLSYLKFSTVTSGSDLSDKVVFFVFKKDTPKPFLCLKTVRNYEAKHAILRNFNNLKKLNKLTDNSPYDHMFAKALYLYDDGENVFSIETICSGRRIKLNKKKLEFIVTEYIKFQEYLTRHNSESTVDIEQFTKEIVTQARLKESDQHEILNFITSLPLTGMRLPRLIQHGDLTEDNALLSKDGLSIIDYDFTGVTDLPGFDLFSFFNRYNQSEVKNLCYKYLPEYFRRIGADLGGDNYDGLFFLYRFIEGNLRKSNSSDPQFANQSAKLIISDFKNIIK